VSRRVEICYVRSLSLCSALSRADARPDFCCVGDLQSRATRYRAGIASIRDEERRGNI
jgi:UDP:flavonoid glycosyltransferase YjiC (YdhE family)